MEDVLKVLSEARDTLAAKKEKGTGLLVQAIDKFVADSKVHLGASERVSKMLDKGWDAISQEALTLKDSKTEETIEGVLKNVVEHELRNVILPEDMRNSNISRHDQPATVLMGAMNTENAKLGSGQRVFGSEAERDIAEVYNYARTNRGPPLESLKQGQENLSPVQQRLAAVQNRLSPAATSNAQPATMDTIQPPESLNSLLGNLIVIIGNHPDNSALPLDKQEKITEHLNAYLEHSHHSFYSEGEEEMANAVLGLINPHLNYASLQLAVEIAGQLGITDGLNNDPTFRDAYFMDPVEFLKAFVHSKNGEYARVNPYYQQFVSKVALVEGNTVAQYIDKLKVPAGSHNQIVKAFQQFLGQFQAAKSEKERDAARVYLHKEALLGASNKDLSVNKPLVHLIFALGNIALSEDKWIKDELHRIGKTVTDLPKEDTEFLKELQNFRSFNSFVENIYGVDAMQKILTSATYRKQEKIFALQSQEAAQDVTDIKAQEELKLISEIQRQVLAAEIKKVSSGDAVIENLLMKKFYASAEQFAKGLDTISALRNSNPEKFKQAGELLKQRREALKKHEVFEGNMMLICCLLYK